MKYAYFKSGDSLGVASAATGERLWLDLPQSGSDCYVSFALEAGGLRANSWSCYLVAIDINTGQIQSRTFTK